MPLLLLRRIPGRLLLRHLFTRNHLSSRSQCRHIGSDTFIPPEMGFSKGFHQHYRLEKLLGSGTFADWVSMLAIGAEFTLVQVPLRTSIPPVTLIQANM